MLGFALSGTLINAIAIVVGGLIGTYLIKGVPESMQTTVINAIAPAVMLIGFKTAWTDASPVTVIIALALGAVIGERLDIDAAINKWAQRLEQRFGNHSGGFAKGFVAATLVFLVGAMAIMGAVENGITGRCDTLMAKSALDGITSIVFGAGFGLGVVFSAVPVLVYQGGIALAAAKIEPLLTASVLSGVNSVGGLLIFGIGLNLVGASRIKIANLLPAIPLVAAITILLDALGGRL